MEARDREALRPPDGRAGRGFAVAPGVSRAGIEQHRDDDQVDPRACAVARRQRRELGVERGGAIDAGGPEVVDPAVDRDP